MDPELRDALDQLRQQVAESAVETRRYVDASAAGLREQVAESAGETRRYVDTVAAESRRHFDVVVEDFRSRFQLLAEGQNVLSERVDRVEASLREDILRAQREMTP